MSHEIMSSIDWISDFVSSDDVVDDNNNHSEWREKKEEGHTVSECVPVSLVTAACENSERNLLAMKCKT